MSRTSPYRAPAQGPRPPSLRRRTPAWAVPAVAAAVLWNLASATDADQPAALSREQRSPLYDRGMLTLAESCGGPGATSIAGFCRHQAELLVQLPECRDECVELARRHLPHATR